MATSVKTQRASGTKKKAASAVKKTSKAKAPSKTVKPASAKKRTASRKPVITATKESARSFVQRFRLPDELRARARRALAPAVDFDPLKEQAAVVGSSVVSFAEGISAESREDVCNATLLAQLAATKKVPDLSKVFPWFDEYFKTLMRVGWNVEQSGFKVHEEETQGLKTHQAILSVLTAALAPAPAALALAIATLEAMQSMDKDNPWITIFNQQSKFETTAHFQIALAEQLANGKLVINLFAFTLDANAKLTQVLFFTFAKNKTTFKYNSAKATINRAVLNSIRDALKTKLASEIAALIAAVEI